MANETATGPEEKPPRRTEIIIGGEQVTPREAMRRLRGMPGGVVEEITKYSLDLRAELVFVVADNELRITVKVKDRDGETDAIVWHAPNKPLAAFGTGNVLNAFLEDVKRNLHNSLRPWVETEAALLTADIIAACASMHGITRDGGETIIKLHTAQSAANLGKLLDGVPKHTGGGLSKIALHQAVFFAAFRLAFQGYKPRALTLDAVNAELRARTGAQVAASGEALRKQLTERGLNWTAIKAAALRAGRGAAEAAREAEAAARVEPPVSEAGGSPKPEAPMAEIIPLKN